MTVLADEEAARQWVRDKFGVSRETALADFAAMVVEENEHQNLISPASITAMWTRHIADSAQLLALASHTPGQWVDIGTGAGFPGMVIALLADSPVTLVEPRRKRADFLSAAAERLGIAHRVTVEARRAEQVKAGASVISARAVAALPDLLAAGHHLSSSDTIWLLPKGINAREEVAVAQRTWHGSFHVEPSITQPGSIIIVATGVSPR